MKKTLMKKKFIVASLLLILMISNFAISFAYWASSISGAVENSDGSINLGEWLEGTQIWNTDDFIQMITTNNNTGVYSIGTDLDFQNITPPSWIQTKEISFKGTLDCGNKTLSNINLVDYRGIFGILEGATIKNCIIDTANINYTVNDNYTSGILAGRMQGTGNIIENITIINSSMNNTNVIAGALIGFISPTSGTGDAVIKNINVSNTTVSGGFSNASYGNGGLIATINNFNLNMENVNVEVDVTSTSNSNVGGLIGTVIGNSTLTINGAHVDQSNLLISGTGNTLGAGGAIGLLNGTNHSLSNIIVTQTDISSASISGGLVGYANQSSGILNLNQIDISNSIINSSISDSASGAGGIIGVINGYTVDMANMNVSSNITSLSNANAGGLAAVVTSSAVVNLNGAIISGASVSINGTGNTLGAGGIIGLLNGNNHTLTNVDLISTVVTSASISGGIIGYANQASSNLILNTVSISGSTIKSSISNTTLGAGGVMGVINGYHVDMTDVGVTADITASNNANVGGIAAVVTSTSTLNLNTISVSGSTVSILGTNTSLGAGGFIGLLNGSTHLFTDIEVLNTNITSVSISGGVIGYANQNSGTLTILGVNVSGSHVTSSIAGDEVGVGGVIGSTNGYLIDITNALVSSTISSTGDSNAGGVIGFVNSSVVLGFENIVVDQSTISSTSTNNSMGSGGIIGLLYGDTHLFTKIRVTDSNITSDTSAGGLIGRSEQKNSTATFNNIKVVSSNIYSSVNSGTSGAGGIIGRNRHYTFVMNDIYIETSISSNRTNVAGLVGFSRYGDFTINRVIIFADLILVDPANGGSRGAAGLIGRNRDGAITSSATDVFFTGYLKARVQNNRPYVGVINAVDDSLVETNVRSAEITYYLDSNPNTLVNNATLYNNMRGQSPNYATTYTTLRSSIDLSYWTTNFSNITNSSLWTYNPTTNLYQLID